jgi:hypothetical protein
MIDLLLCVIFGLDVVTNVALLIALFIITVRIVRESGATNA